MKYLIGIDGGGTGSRCVITDMNAEILYRCKGGPTNFLRYDISEVCKTIYTLINACKKNLKISFGDIKAVVIGTAGAGREKDALYLEKQVKEYLKSKDAFVKFICVVSDGLITIESALSNQPGCVLISGTGSIIIGKNKDGKYFRLGGYGNIIGDEGSGYSIGKRGLIAAAREYDGRGKKTLLTIYLRKYFKINSGQDLIDSVYRGKFNIASFARLVFKAAVKNDKVSIEIINDEADELVQLLKNMKKLINIKNLKLAFSGSLLSSKNYYYDLLVKKINNTLSGVQIIKPEYPPEVGAILYALRFLKVK